MYNVFRVKEVIKIKEDTMKKYLVTVEVEDQTLRRIANEDVLKLLRQTKVSVSDVDSGYYSKPVSFNKAATVKEVTDEEIETLNNLDVLDDTDCIRIDSNGLDLAEADDWENVSREQLLADFM